MKLATTTGDFRAYTDNQKDAVRWIREAGFRYADYYFGMDYQLRNGAFSEDWQAYANDLRQYAQEIGIQFVQAHAPIAEDNAAFIADNIRCIEVCAILGIPNLVIHTGYRMGLSKEETFEENKAFFEPLLQVAEMHNVNILVENFNIMCVEGMYWIDNAEDLLTLIEYIHHPYLHAVWDAGHGNLQQMTQQDQLMVLGEHVYALHIQDNMGDTDSHLPPFCGTLDLDSLMRGLLAIGYTGYFTFETRSRFRATEQTEEASARLAIPPLALRIAEERLLYETGKCILSTYDCFEG